MASSQVEIASSSSPFGGCVLRDHRCNPFQKDLKHLVVDSCISTDNIDFTDLWVHHPQTQSTNKPTNHSTNNHSNIDKQENNGGKANNNNNNITSSSRGSKAGNKTDKWAKAREMVLTGGGCGGGGTKDQDHQPPPEQVVAALHRDNSPPASTTSSSEIPNLGVSSLVRKWRDFEAESKCPSLNTSSACSTRSNSGTIFIENAESTSRASNVCEDSAGDERFECHASNDDAFGDWDSDRITLSGPPSSQGRDSDATESERIRVADIIRKLTATGEDTNDRDHSGVPESLPRIREPLDQSEHKCFTSSPRLRGRQAFNDLLMYLERDRHRELEGLVARKVVSKFSQRGRIQAMLKVRFLRRGMEAKACEGRHLNSSLFEPNRLNIGERFKPGHPNCKTQSGSSHRVDNTLRDRKFCTSNQQSEENKIQEVRGSTVCCRLMPNDIQHAESCSAPEHDELDHNFHETRKNAHQNILPGQSSQHLDRERRVVLNFIELKTSSKASNHGLAESARIETPTPKKVDKNKLAKAAVSVEEKAKRKHLIGTDKDSICEPAQRDHCQEEDTHYQNLPESDEDRVSEASHPEYGWAELQSEYQQQVGINTSTDWMIEISRPRSDWEGLRQERYQEMLDPFTDNEEIRRLLERKSVSKFLSSELKVKIDRLMISRAQHQPKMMAQMMEEEEAEEQREKSEEVAVYGRGDEDEGAEEQDEAREDDGDYYEEYEEEEEEDQINLQYNEVDVFTDQMTSSPSTIWHQDQDHDRETSDNFSGVASPYLERSLPSTSPSQQNHQTSPFPNLPSIEMELIYDLRGHMEQLQREMSELRRSIGSCINMQIKLQQRCVKQEATLCAVNHPGTYGKREEKSRIKGASCKERCRMCHDSPVDSLLYRCGHMCACLKCAQELQLGSGKCPICKAPILDVVRILAAAR